MGRWLEAEISRRDPGATLALIERLAAQGTDLGVLEYARGEAFRARDDKGDQALALASYAKATTYADAPAAAWRQIGVMHRKMGDKAAAATAFEKYLETAPAASDRQLVTDMLVTLKGGGS
jgi:tetratricopeptide (TPR) repeat protein